MNRTKAIAVMVFIILITSIYSLWALLNYGEYAWTLFITVPFLFSLCISYVLTTEKSTIKVHKVLLLIVGIIVGLTGLLFFTGLEGILCITISFPLLFLPSTIGSLIGCLLKKYQFKNKLNSFVFLVFILPISSYLDKINLEEFNSTVKTELIINSSIENVWSNLTEKVEFNKDLPFFFKKGITIPVSMELTNTDSVNTKLNVNTNNGDFIPIPVSEIIKNKSIEFNPNDLTPRPMKELSVHGDFDAKHLDGYLTVNSGKFELEIIDKEKVKIIATTNYNYKIGPSFYWKWVSDKIIDNVHLHVLKSIKNKIDNE